MQLTEILFCLNYITGRLHCKFNISSRLMRADTISVIEPKESFYKTLSAGAHSYIYIIAIAVKLKQSVDIAN